MIGLRRALGSLAALWVVCQLGSVAASIAVWVSSSAAECTCRVGDHATCPMHHKNTSSVKVCAMRGMNDPASLMLSSAFGLTGLIPTSTHAVVLTSIPDPPPPRA
jgi:hypothetical protein